MLLWTVLQAESKRAWLLTLRYPAKLVGELLTGMLLVGSLTLGTGAASDPAETLHRLTGYLVVLLSLAGLHSVHAYVKEHVEMGTLEHVYMSPLGLRGLAVVRILTDFVRTSLLLIVTGLVLAGLFHVRVIGSWQLVPVCILIFIAMSGLGLLLGALALRFKRTSALANVISLVCLGVVTIPGRFLPGLLRDAITFATPFGFGSSVVTGLLAGKEVQVEAWSHLALLAVGCWLAGSAVFQRAEEIARRDGELAAL